MRWDSCSFFPAAGIFLAIQLQTSNRDCSKKTARILNQTATYQTASRGFAWSFFASGISTAASLIAQLLLGRLLSEGDFGEYAIAIGLANLLAVLREGGITDWLARMLPDEYAEHRRAAQGLSYVLAWASLPLLFLLGWLAGNLYGSIPVRNVMWILALAFPFLAYSTVGRAGMQSTLRFASLARLRIVTDLVRYSLMVLFGLLGCGAVSFALPSLIVAVIESAGFYLLTGVPPWPGITSRATRVRVLAIEMVLLRIAGAVLAAQRRLRRAGSARAKRSRRRILLRFPADDATGVYLRRKPA